jgi:hypothetical protein
MIYLKKIKIKLKNLAVNFAKKNIKRKKLKEHLDVFMKIAIYGVV